MHDIQNDNNVKTWLESLGLRIRAARRAIVHHDPERAPPNVQASHVCLDGGSFEIPDKHLQEFYERYVRDWGLGRQLCFVEIKSVPLFRMFVDLDFVELAALSTDDTLVYVREIHAIVLRCFVGKFHAIVSTTAPRALALKTGSQQEKGNEGCLSEKSFGVKTGIHVVWPDLLVDNALGMRLCRKIQDCLFDCFGAREYPMNPWADVIDSSVMRSIGTGLRMKGSSKPSMKNTCIYQPYVVLNESGEIDHEMFEKTCGCSKLSYVISTTIRETSSEARVSELVSVDILDLKERIDNNFENAIVGGVSVTSFGGGTTPGSFSCMEELMLTPENAWKLQDFFSIYFPKYHNSRSGFKIRKVVVAGGESKDNTNKCVVILTECRYCGNKGGEHESNNVYFVANGGTKTMYQKCFCTCNVNRKYSLCSKYRGAPVRISSHMCSILGIDQGTNNGTGGKSMFIATDRVLKTQEHCSVSTSGSNNASASASTIPDPASEAAAPLRREVVDLDTMMHARIFRAKERDKKIWRAQMESIVFREDNGNDRGGKGGNGKGGNGKGGKGNGSGKGKGKGK